MPLYLAQRARLIIVDPSQKMSKCFDNVHPLPLALKNSENFEIAVYFFSFWLIKIKFDLFTLLPQKFIDPPLAFKTELQSDIS